MITNYREYLLSDKAVISDMSEAVETLSCVAGPSCSTCHQMSLLCSSHSSHICTQGGSPLTTAGHHTALILILLGLGEETITTSNEDT